MAYHSELLHGMKSRVRCQLPECSEDVRAFDGASHRSTFLERREQFQENGILKFDRFQSEARSFLPQRDQAVNESLFDGSPEINHLSQDRNPLGDQSSRFRTSLPFLDTRTHRRPFFMDQSSTWYVLSRPANDMMRPRSDSTTERKRSQLARYAKYPVAPMRSVSETVIRPKKTRRR